MLVDHRGGKFFGGIILQEFNEQVGKLIGAVHHIFEGSELGITEGPHIYQRNGYYYLITAEGGTEYGHAVTLARSKNLLGPYEVHPQNPIISARDNPNATFQKLGHADIVEMPSGEWYIVCLTGRPLTQRGRCTLGRETVIEQLEWREDGWAYLKNGSREVRKFVPAPAENATPKPHPERSRRAQSQPPFDLTHFQSLRVPITEEWLSPNVREGYLRLYGRESLSSFHEQSLIARRVQHFDIEATTCVEYSPTTFQQMAGLSLIHI